MLASGGFDNTVRISSIETGKLLYNLSGHNNSIFRLLFSLDGKIVISVDESRRLIMWSLDEKRNIREYNGYSEIAISPNGKFLATASPKEILEIWHMDSGELYRTLDKRGRGEEGKSESDDYVIAFSPDSEFFVHVKTDFNLIVKGIWLVHPEKY